MAVTITLKKSSVANKRPVATALVAGEIAVNYSSGTGGLFYTDSGGQLVKVGPTEFGATAPNSAPAGSTGNSVGEFWFDTANNVLNVWSGTTWRPSAVAASLATPTVEGLVLGCTNTTNAFYGCGAGVLGAASGGNVGVGVSALPSVSTGAFNTAIGRDSGFNVSTGSRNVVIGYCSQVPSGTASCQLAIGFSDVDYWVTGDNLKHIRPGAGIRDCTGNLGSSGQYLMSTGNAIVWAPIISTLATPTTFGVIKGCTTLSNTSLGDSALLAGTGTSNFNTAVGNQAGTSITFGSNNTLLGHSAGCSITIGSCNIAIGFNSQVASPTDSCQLAIGLAPSFNWLTGTSTKAIRPGAGIIDCAGSCGAAGQVLMSNGANALCWGTVSSGPATPTVLGPVFGCTLSSGTFSTFLGNNAGVSVPTGLRNVGVGYSASMQLTTGEDNVAVGTSSQTNTTTGGCNTSIGTFTLPNNSTGQENTALGFRALQFNSTSSRNVAVGALSGFNTTGGSNVTIGYSAQVENVAGSCQLAIGFNTGQNWLTGTSTKAIRPGAGIIDCNGSCGTLGQVLSSTGTNGIVWGAGGGSVACATPTVLGTVVGWVNCTVNNAGAYLGLFAGCAAHAGQIATSSVGVGSRALEFETTGATGNVAVGNGTLRSLTTASCNVAIGLFAGNVVTTGFANTVVGAGSGSAVTTGGCNTFVGRQAGASVTTGCNNIVIGFGAASSSATVNNEVTIGTALNNSYRIFGTWANISDGRDKSEVEDLALGLDFVNTLRPVKFTWNFREETDRNGDPDIGFIAQDVLEAQKSADADYAGLVSESDPERLMLAQAKLFPVLVKALQEVSDELTEVKSRLSTLEKG